MLNRIAKALAAGKKLCGVNNFTCGKCPACQRKEEERWNSIWKQKYAEQEARYYDKNASFDPERRSFTQSSLNTNERIDTGDWTTFTRLRGRGGQENAAGPSTPETPGKKSPSSLASRLLPLKS